MSRKSTPNDEAPLSDVLDARIAGLIHEIEATTFWKELTNSRAKPDFVRAFLREVYLEIASYQPHVIEAAICSIGQMPRSMPVRMVKAMLRHQAEEFDHGEMAVRDYIALGGSEESARDGLRMSNASFTVSAVWWMITKMRDPFAYLGALYPFEGLTPIVSQKVMDVLAKSGFPENAKEYLTFHATEDIKHANLIKAMINETAERYPEARASIIEGMDRFLSVYPIPVWTTAYARAKAGQA